MIIPKVLTTLWKASFQLFQANLISSLFLFSFLLLWFLEVDHSISAFLQTPEFLLIKSALCYAHFLGRRKGQRQSWLFLILWKEKLRPRGALSRWTHPAWFKGSWPAVAFCQRRRNDPGSCQLGQATCPSPGMSSTEVLSTLEWLGCNVDLNQV